MASIHIAPISRFRVCTTFMPGHPQYKGLKNKIHQSTYKYSLEDAQAKVEEFLAEHANKHVQAWFEEAVIAPRITNGT